MEDDIPGFDLGNYTTAKLLSEAVVDPKAVTIVPGEHAIWSFTDNEGRAVSIPVVVAAVRMDYSNIATYELAVELGTSGVFAIVPMTMGIITVNPEVAPIPVEEVLSEVPKIRGHLQVVR